MELPHIRFSDEELERFAQLAMRFSDQEFESMVYRMKLTPKQTAFVRANKSQVEAALSAALNRKFGEFMEEELKKKR